MVVELHSQQSLAKTLGRTQAMRACLPACLYMLARAHGYIDAKTDLAAFCSGLDWDQHADNVGWKRAKLTHYLRGLHQLEVVSWWLNGKYDRAAMTASGYITTEREWDFFDTTVKGRDVLELVKDGYTVIATVKPGFSHNTGVHAVILNEHTDGIVRVIDPDSRNKRTDYTEAEIRAALSEVGAASIVLPRKLG